MNERNRPMLDADVAAVETSPWARKLRALVARYGREALPVMNGAFRYSNLREGDDQILTCHPYRLWEYASLFLAYDEARPWQRALDVGGAASPLPYLLAETGITTRAVDLQPLLVAVCNHVAAVRGLPLEARVEDVTTDGSEDSSYDLVTFVSVLEHIDVAARPRVLESLYRRLRPGGLLYLTFDYGHYVEKDEYRSERGAASHRASSIHDVAEIAAALERCGFTFEGNDPRALPADVLRRTSAPRYREIMRRHATNAGPFDARTPAATIAKYLLRRFLHAGPVPATRYEQHNFFRMFLRKPEETRA